MKIINSDDKKDTKGKVAEEAKEMKELEVPQPVDLPLEESYKRMAVPEIKVPAPSDDLKLSENFKLGDFYKSASHPVEAAAMLRTDLDVLHLKRLCENALQPIRDRAKHAVNVNSGKRDTRLNKLVGGEETSDHLNADAADIDLKDKEAWEMLLWLYENKKIQVGQVIVYVHAEKLSKADWLHVSNVTAKHNRDFRVKISGNPKYYKYGIEQIPGIHYV